MTSSLETNLQALVSIHSLTHAQSALQVTEKRVSTGYNVADALDNGAIYAIAQSILNSNAGLSAVNSQLNGASGLTVVANAALTQVSDLMTQVTSVLTQLSDQSISSDTRAQLATQYTNLLSSINTDLTTAGYQGTNLLNTSGTVGVIQDVLANQFVLAGQASTVGQVVANLSVAQATSVTSAGAFLLNTFMTELNLVASSLNTVGYLNQSIRSIVQYNTHVSAAQTEGLGALVDANLPAESTRLRAEQIRAHLAAESLSITNHNPATLLNLFGTQPTS
jgi:flagellin